MNNKWHPHEPTAEQTKQTKRVELAVVNELNLLAKEGVPMACIMTALGVTIADILIAEVGPGEVAPWFERQAELMRELLSTPRNLN